MLRSIEKIISRELNRFPQIKQIVKRSYTLPFMMTGQMFMQSRSVARRTEIGEQDVESFFGYYDLFPQNSNGLVLCHQSRHPTWVKPDPSKPIDVCLFASDAPTSPLIKTQTYAYNWQQGSRLQWLSEDFFIFNDFDQKRRKYHSRIFDARNGKEIGQVDLPIQTRINETCFLSLNYQRLACLRPDYGYFNLPPEDCDVAALDDDGIWIVNAADRKSQLLYSISDVVRAGEQPKVSKLKHKVNHLMLSPDNNRFVLLHRMFDGERRSGRLMIGDIGRSPLRVLPGDSMISHYCWVNDNILLCFMRTDEHGDGYYLVNVDTQIADFLPSLTALTPGDGHPVSLSDCLFMTDSYPDRYGYQKLMLCNYQSQQVSEIASLYHGRKYNGVTRCDLHPRVKAGQDYCFFDSVASGKRRLNRMQLTLC